MDFDSGHILQDGSVKWPRWKVLATGGFAAVQLNDRGQVSKVHAVTLDEIGHHSAVVTELAVMGATASMVPGTGEVCIWTDCAAVVQGYAKLPAIADDHRNTHACCRNFKVRQT